MKKIEIVIFVDNLRQNLFEEIKKNEKNVESDRNIRQLSEDWTHIYRLDTISIVYQCHPVIQDIC